MPRAGNGLLSSGARPSECGTYLPPSLAQSTVRPEVTEWLGRAERDLQVAHDLLGLGHWAAGGFHAQQAAEKALKAAVIGAAGSLDRTHDLVRLARRLGAPEPVERACDALNPFYMADRYPDTAVAVDAKEAAAALRDAQEVVRWVQAQTSSTL